MTQSTVHEMPADLERRPDPYPWLTEMREAGPVQRVKMRGEIEAWLVTRYDDVFAAITDPRLRSDPRIAGEHIRNSPAFRGRAADDVTISMLSADPPDHTRLRRLVSKAFTARRIEQLRPRIQEIADRLLDGFGDRDEVDLIAEYAF